MTRGLLKAVLATVVTSVIGLVAVWTREPLLAPSLASAAFGQILTPDTPSAKPWSIAAGQGCGLIGGLSGVYLSGAFAAPMFMGSHKLVYARVLAVSIAVLVSSALQLALRATSPTGGATAIIVAIGAETANWAGAGRMLAGIALVTALGEAARRMVLRTA